MPIDPDKAKALRLPAATMDVERGALRRFAKATGQTDPIYLDVGAARAAGHPDLPVPPTYFFSIELEHVDLMQYLAELGVDLTRFLHGEQSFEYHAMAHAGDRLIIESGFTDVYTKKGGALEFLVKTTEITREPSDHIATATTSIVIRHPEVER